MAAAPHHPLSLTTRLMLSYALGSILAIAATGWYLRSALIEQRQQETYELLINHITSLRNSVLENADSPRRSLESLLSSSARDPLHSIHGRLTNRKGEVLFNTLEMSRLSLATPFPASLSGDQDTQIVKDPRSKKPLHDTYWVAANIAGIDAGNDTIYQAQYVDTHLSDWVKTYNGLWLRATLIGGMSFSFLGWCIARRGLRPLHQIAQALGKITAKDLNERISTDEWPREITALAGEFDRMLTRLQQSFRQLSQFTGDAAHEFRTPLNNLLGATSLALSKERSPEQYIALLQSHVEQFNRLNRMIESLLFLARADNSSSGFQLQQVDVGACAREVLDFFSAVAEEREIQLQARGEATIMADESMLRIALSNLVSNGLRFTPHGKKLTIIVERKEQHEVVVSVIDSGPGIAPEHYENIFDRYYRLEKSRTSEGAGLGLSIVQTIMKLHGGKALVDRAAGGGAVFSLVFPS